MGFRAATLTTVLIFDTLALLYHGGFVASEQQKAKGEGKVIPQTVEAEWSGSKGCCHTQEPPRLSTASGDRFHYNHEVSIMDMQMVLSDHGNESGEMLGLLLGLEGSNVATQKIQVKSQAGHQTKRTECEFEPFQKDQQGWPMGCLLTSGEDGSDEGCSERCQRGKWFLRRQESQRWRTRSCRCKRCYERAFEVLHFPDGRPRPFDQDSHREPHQGRERKRWGTSWPLEQGGDVEESDWQASDSDQRSRSGMDYVQVHHEKEVQRTERWLQGTKEKSSREAEQEGNRVSRCFARIEEKGECRDESNGTRIATRRPHRETSPRGRALGSRRFRRREAGIGREEIEKSSTRALQEIESQKDLKKSRKQEADGAPGPNLEAAPAMFDFHEKALIRIGELPPLFQAFCLTGMCISLFVVESLYSMTWRSALGVAVMSGTCLCTYLFSLSRCTKRKRLLCCVGRRRHARKVPIEKRTNIFKIRFFFYLLIWNDIGVMALAENVPARKDSHESKLDNSEVCLSPDSCRIGQHFDFFQYDMINQSASWPHTGGSRSIMELQRPLGTQIEEIRQAAFERNLIVGEEEIMAEVAALNAQNQNEGFCIMTHALKPEHRGTREIQMNLMHGDDFYDMIFAIRQRWYDVIHPSLFAVILYVFPQPPPSTTAGKDCLHVIVDGEARRGGIRNLVAMAMCFRQGQFSEFWFQAQRNHDEISHDELVRRFGINIICESAAAWCTSRAGLTVFQEDVNYENQDGLFMTMELDFSRQEEDGDTMSLMARTRHVNRLVAYVFRHGESDPIFIQLSEVPEAQRMDFIHELLATRRGPGELGHFTIHGVLAMPNELQGREIMRLIQDFHVNQREYYVVILMDVEVYPGAPDHGRRPSDEWREVTYVRKATDRHTFLRDAELGAFCEKGESNCIVERNGVVWSEQDEEPTEIENGSYLRVQIQQQRMDLPFCVQFEQAQRGIRLNDMIDTRQSRKRQRSQDDGSSYSSDSSTLLQIDSALGRNFHREKREKLSPPGNGVDFDAEVSVIDENKVTKVYDRSTGNQFIASFCETRDDEPRAGLLLDFIRKVRFGEIDDSSDEENEMHEAQVEASQIRLENLLPICSRHTSSIEDIISELRIDPAAKYPSRHDWHNIHGMHPTVKAVLDAQPFCLTGSVIRMHIFSGWLCFLHEGRNQESCLEFRCGAGTWQCSRSQLQVGWICGCALDHCDIEFIPHRRDKVWFQRGRMCSYVLGSCLDFILGQRMHDWDHSAWWQLAHSEVCYSRMEMPSFTRIDVREITVSMAENWGRKFPCDPEAPLWPQRSSRQWGCWFDCQTSGHDQWCLHWN